VANYEDHYDVLRFELLYEIIIIVSTFNLLNLCLEQQQFPFVLLLFYIGMAMCPYDINISPLPSSKDDNQDLGQVVAFFETQFLVQQAYCGFQ